MNAPRIHNRLRIAMVGSRGVPAAYSGVERAIEEVGARLVAKGHDVTVFCMSRRYKDKRASYRGMMLRYLPSIPGKHSEMLLHAAMSSLAAGLGRFDVVHFHACGPSLFAGVPRLLGKSTVATLHGNDWMAAKWGRLASIVLRLGELSACHLASKATCVSMTSQADLRRRLGLCIECVSNGVVAGAGRPLNKAARAFGLLPRQYITFVGRLTGSKNVHHLIEAFMPIRTNMKLLIIGGDSADPGYVRHLKGMARGDERIIFTGMLEGELLEEICSNAYLFCLPSRHEGMSIALLEALAYGVPVLVSDIDANIEVIGGRYHGCGLTFRVGSVADLRQRLMGAVAVPGMLDEYRAQGPALVADRYSWDKAAAELARVYSDLLSDSGTRKRWWQTFATMPASENAQKRDGRPL